MKLFPLRLLSLLLCLLFAGCHSSAPRIETYNTPCYTPQHAHGFRILQAKEGKSRLIEVVDPWQDAHGVVRRLLILRGNEAIPSDYTGPVLHGEARRIVCLSSSYIAMLDALGASDRVVGVSGLRFVNNPKVRARMDASGDVGYDGNFDYERLVALDADLVLLYGVTGPGALEAKLKELRIPYLYMGEYVEQNPLGKAEWMVVVGECINRREKAEALFAPIPAEYTHWREVAAALPQRPKVMLNTPYADSWFMPSTSSYIARLVADAGGDYLYRANDTNISRTIDLEEATLLTAEADCWLDASNLATLSDLKQRYPRFADLKCVARGEVYNNDLRAIPNGGNDYWESGVIHPHLILRDLVKILHPEAVEEPFVYYRRLE